MVMSGIFFLCWLLVSLVASSSHFGSSLSTSNQRPSSKDKSQELKCLNIKVEELIQFLAPSSTSSSEMMVMEQPGPENYSEFYDEEEEEEEEEEERKRAWADNSPWLTEYERAERYEVWFCDVGEIPGEPEHRHRNERPFPCLFSTDPRTKGVYVECYGSGVDQTTVENAFREVRRVKKIPEDQGIHIHKLSIDRTEMTQLDLAPFYGSHMNFLSISNNFNLSKLVTSGNPEDHRSIHVKDFYIGNSPINREGFGDTLKYFSNELTSFSAYDIDLNFLNHNNNNNNNKDFDENQQQESEFLPGLSGLRNLTELALISCNISGQLESDFLIPKELQSLRRATFSNNKITDIGENVFHFYTNPLIVDLRSNQLTENSFHPNSGITRAGRETALWISHNQISSVPAAVFEPFLDAQSGNSLDLDRTPLHCDERVSWLKSRREEFQSRVKDPKCGNDPYRTIFTSDSIP